MNVQEHLTSAVDREQARKLPQMIEKFSRDTNLPLSLEYLHLLFNWMHSLERAHYKTQQFRNESNYERRLERVLLFVEFSRQECHKDGALLMVIWRHQFGAVEVLLLCRMWRIAIAGDRERILRKLRDPQLVFVKTFLTIQQQLINDGRAVTADTITDSWRDYNLRKGNKLGKVALDNFRNRVIWFQQVLISRSDMEQAWVPQPAGRRNIPQYE